MSRSIYIACALVAAACGKPADKPRTGPVRIDVQVKNYDRDSACKPKTITFEVKTEAGAAVHLAGVKGIADGRGIWVAAVPSTTLETLATKQKRVAITARVGSRTGTSSYSLHLVGNREWLRRYPKGLDKLKLDANGWDSAYLGCNLASAKTSAGTATIVANKLVHWIIPYKQLGQHVRFTAKAATGAQHAQATLTVTNTAGKTQQFSTSVVVAGKHYKAFIATLKSRAGTANPRAPKHVRGKGPHPLLYFNGNGELNTRLAAGKTADQVALFATSKDRFRSPGLAQCVYRRGNNRQQVSLLQVNPTVTVYSARTGKRVARRSFVGLTPTCPKTASSVRDVRTGHQTQLSSALGKLPTKTINAWLETVAR